MVATRRSQPNRVHGPCERCGALYYSVQTRTRPICPNCGHEPAAGD